MIRKLWVLQEMERAGREPLVTASERTGKVEKTVSIQWSWCLWRTPKCRWSLVTAIHDVENEKALPERTQSSKWNSDGSELLQLCTESGTCRPLHIWKAIGDLHPTFDASSDQLSLWTAKILQAISHKVFGRFQNRSAGVGWSGITYTSKHFGESNFDQRTVLSSLLPAVAVVLDSFHRMPYALAFSAASPNFRWWWPW